MWVILKNSICLVPEELSGTCCIQIQINCFNGTALFLDVKILLGLGSEFSPKLVFEHWAILRFMILITNFLVLRSLFHGLSAYAIVQLNI